MLREASDLEEKTIDAISEDCHNGRPGAAVFRADGVSCYLTYESAQFQDWVVLGIGINVHTRTEDFPCDLQSIATSIYPDEKMSGVRNRLSAEIINRILGFETLPSETEIFEKYKKRLMVLGKKITVIQNQAEYKATAIDVDSVGHLVVKNESGERITLSSGEIRI